MASTINASTSAGLVSTADTSGVLQLQAAGTTVLNGELGKALALQGATSTTGCGIAFPSAQVTSTDPNTLDDYEEGTYTPTVATTGGSITLNASYNTLSYVKVGQLVTITGRLRVSAISSPTGTLTFTLPFNTAAGTQESARGECFGVGVEGATVSMNSYIIDWGASSSTFGVFLLSGTTYTSAAPNITASSLFAFSFSYRCTA